VVIQKAYKNGFLLMADFFLTHIRHVPILDPSIRKEFHLLKGFIMPTLTVSLETIADTLKKLNKKELEALTDLLTDQGRELLKRKKDIDQRRVKALSRDEVFGV
jgi:hypothetical protein